MSPAWMPSFAIWGDYDRAFGVAFGDGQIRP
jgi:hypothetical protein